MNGETIRPEIMAAAKAAQNSMEIEGFHISDERTQANAFAAQKLVDSGEGARRKAEFRAKLAAEKVKKAA